MTRRIDKRKTKMNLTNQLRLSFSISPVKYPSAPALLLLAEKNEIPLKLNR